MISFVDAELPDLIGHTSIVYCLTLLANGYLASGDYYGDIRIWDLPSSSLIQVLSGHSSTVWEIKSWDNYSGGNT